MASGSAPPVLMLSVSGMRGTFGGTLTPEVVTRYCGAFAGWVRQQSGKPKARPHIVVGHDGRAGSETVAALACSALQLSGCDVTALTIPMMTPSVGFAVDSLNASAGLQVTASHNPQEWCGLKPIVREPGAKKGAVSASAPGKTTADDIIARYRDAASPALANWDSLGQRTSLDVEVLTEHPAHVVGLLDDMGLLPAIKKAKFHAALDSVTTSGLMPASVMLEEIGVKVSDLNDHALLARGLFPHTPEPTRDNLVGLSRFVKKSKGKVHVGFAQDPDGDRLAVVDELGNYIGEEYTLVLAAMAMGELGQLKKGQILAVNLSTSRMIEDVASWYGCYVVRTAVGEANVVEGMRANKCPLGGEGNGGVIWPKVTYIRDSLGGMALILALMAKRKQTISQLVEQVPTYSIVKRKIDLNPAINPRDVVAALADKYAQHAPDRTDGVWVNFTNRRAWLHVRASNTEPIMRLIAEAPTAEQAGAILDEAAAVV